MSGIISIVATPIGNLQDITLRALETLRQADLIVCEDTRVTSKLLASFEIKKSLLSVHEHSKAGKLEDVIRGAGQGKRVVYVCDAGTPGMNDPGGKLVQLAYELGVKVEPIPGVSALTSVISVCGFPMDDFFYAGFAPHKKGRQTFFAELAERKIPTIFLESTHRILKTIDVLIEVLGPSRLIFVGRELTKMHETLYRGTAAEIKEQLAQTSTKGEFTLIVGPKPKE